MDRIEFARLLDTAIKCLPAAQKILEQSKTWGANEEKYFSGLSHVAQTILGKATSTAIEIAAAQLLLELADYKIYDLNSPELKEFDPQELRDLSIRKITAAADRLTEIIGRTISLDDLIPTNTPAAKGEAAKNTTPGDDIPGKLPRTTIGKLAVKAAWQIEQATGKRAMARQVIEKLQSWVDHKDNPNAVAELTEKIPNGVKWVTGKGKPNNYDMGVCEKTLATWNKSRA